MPETATETPAAAAGDARDIAAWRDAVLLVLRSARDHTVACGEEELECFREVVVGSMTQLEQNPTVTQVLITAGVLSQAISHHGQQTQRRVNGLLSETAAAIQDFLGHLDKLHPHAESQELLAEIRTTTEKAVSTGQLREARPAVRERLAALEALAEEKRKQTLELTGKLQDRVTILEQSGGAKVPVAVESSESLIDPNTGLPMRAEAEEALRRLIDENRQTYAVVFYLHRMQLTNARFGEAIGNQVILFCSQHIATTITRATDALYRWTGPAFVAIVERAESHLAVSGEIQRLMSTPLSRFFETPSRSVYLPMKVTADVFPLFETNYA